LIRRQPHPAIRVHGIGQVTEHDFYRRT
jgi:hypothetical protein